MIGCPPLMPDAAHRGISTHSTSDVDESHCVSYLRRHFQHKLTCVRADRQHLRSVTRPSATRTGHVPRQEFLTMDATPCHPAYFDSVYRLHVVTVGESPDVHTSSMIASQHPIRSTRSRMHKVMHPCAVSGQCPQFLKPLGSLGDVPLSWFYHDHG